MLVIELRGGSIPVRELRSSEKVWYGGHANQISEESTVFPQIQRIHCATKLIHPMPSDIAVSESSADGPCPIKLPPPISSPRTFGEVVRMRRSALNFVGGPRAISLPQLATLLRVTTRPFSGDFSGARFIRLYVYAHRVDGLEPGVYRLCGDGGTLEQITSGDQRVAAAGLSLGQELAGNACVTFSMIGDLQRATESHDNRGYRYVHFEAGAIGQRLYLAAEALGLGATGIGAFYDDEVHRHLNLAPGKGQVIYHFAIGYPVYDSRLNA
jgi:SagB-type dehydrogenase family enzyme